MIKTKKGKRLVLECICLFRFQVSTNTKTENSDLDLPDLAETAKSIIVKNSIIPDFLYRLVIHSSSPIWLPFTFSVKTITYHNGKFLVLTQKELTN